MHVKKPVRVKHTYTQHIQATPADVFPLLCPVRECEWVEGWAPRLVLSDSGIAEQDCVFVTPDGDAEAIWVVTAYDPESYHVAFVKITPDSLVINLDISLADAGNGDCHSTVSYMYTALSAEGENRVADMTEEAYLGFMQEWEAALNEFLNS